mgnify:FL=1|tara:strand:+ start:136 stop:549 length:414 start_codon:yes stop_codon:yes gene_type:complete
MIKFVILLPFLELILFILFGDILGFFNVLTYILITGILGFWLIFPSKGYTVDIKTIATEPVEWIFKRFAGILLVIPGFITDFLGILVLIKPLRKFIWSFLPSQFINFGYNFKNESSKQDITKNENIIEGEYKDLDKK